MSFKEWLYENLTTDDEIPTIDPDECDLDDFDRDYVLNATELDDSHIQELYIQYKRYCEACGQDPVNDFE